MIAVLLATALSRAETPDSQPEVPPEQRFSITVLDRDAPGAPAPGPPAPVAPALDEPAPAAGPVLRPDQLQALLQQLQAGAVPPLDPAALQDPRAILMQLPPEQAARIEAARDEAVREAERAALQAAEAVRRALENPGQPPTPLPPPGD